MESKRLWGGRGSTCGAGCGAGYSKSACHTIKLIQHIENRLHAIEWPPALSLKTLIFSSSDDSWTNAAEKTMVVKDLLKTVDRLHQADVIHRGPLPDVVLVNSDKQVSA